MMRTKRAVGYSLVFLLCVLLSSTAAAETVTLEVWIVDANAETQKLLLEKIVPEFEARYPHVKIDMTFPGWTGYYDKIYTTHAAGVAPDIYQAGSKFRGQAALDGFALNLDKYTAEWEDKADFFPGSWAAVHYDGSDYGVPSLSAPRSIIYRADMLAEAGYDPEAPPYEWEDILSAAVRLSKVDQDGNTLSLGMSVPWANWDFWMTLLWQAGGELLSDDGNEALWNTPAGLASLEYYLELYNRVAAFGSAPAGGLATGAYAMYYGATRGASELVRTEPALDGLVRVGPPMKGVRQATAVYTDWVLISSQTKHPDEAWEFVKWLSDVDNLALYNETLQYIPPRKSAISLSYISENYYIQQAIEKVMPYGVVNPAHSDEFSPMMTNQIQRLFRGEISPQQMLDDAERAFVPLRK